MPVLNKFVLQQAIGMLHDELTIQVILYHNMHEFYAIDSSLPYLCKHAYQSFLLYVANVTFFYMSTSLR